MKYEQEDLFNNLGDLSNSTANQSYYAADPEPSETPEPLAKASNSAEMTPNNATDGANADEREPENKIEYLTKLMNKGYYLYPTYPMTVAADADADAVNEAYKMTKNPLAVPGVIKNDYRAAVNDPELINVLFNPKNNGRQLTNNVGIYLKNSKLICLDFDRPEAFKQWLPLYPEMLLTPIEYTKHGTHVYFANDLTTAEAKAIKKKLDHNGVEFQTDSAIIYPSVHKGLAGNLNLADSTPKPLSKELKAALIEMSNGSFKKIEKAKPDEIDNSSNDYERYYNNVLNKARRTLEANYSKGGRNDALTYYGIKLMFLKFTPIDIAAELTNYRDILDHEDRQLPDSEIQSIVKSVQKYNEYNIDDDFAKKQKEKKPKFQASEKDEKGKQVNDLGFVCYKDGTPKKDVLNNFLHAFELQDEKFSKSIKFNSFLGEYQYKKDGKWIEADPSLMRKLQINFEKRYNLIPGNSHILKDGFNEYAEQHAVNPYQDTIKATEWDGVKRVETLFIDYLDAADNEYNRMAARKFLVSTVTRLFYPGCATDLMAILIGKQGIGKTVLLQKLAGNAYVGNLPSLNAGNKETAQLLQRALIVEISELEAMNKTGIDAVKAFLSTYTDIFRKPYDDKARNYPRQFGIIGTTNDMQPLHDGTGNRRFLPVYCGNDSKLKASAINQYTRWQILREAYNLMTTEIEIAKADGYKVNDIQDLRLSNDHEKAIAKVEQQKAFAADPVYIAINDYISLLVPKNWNEFSKADRSEYFKYTQVYPDYPKVQDGQNIGHHGTYNKADLVPMEALTNDELKTIALSPEYNPFITPSELKTVQKKIRLYFADKDNWKPSKNIRSFNGKRTRGYQLTDK